MHDIRRSSMPDTHLIAPSAFAAELRRLARQVVPQPTTAPAGGPGGERGALAAGGHARWLWSPLGEDVAGRVRRLLLLDPSRDWSAALVAKQLGLGLAT